MRTIKDKLSFGFGLLSLAIALLDFSSRNSPYGGTWHHYGWLVWALASAGWLWRAFNPVPVKPE